MLPDDYGFMTSFEKPIEELLFWRLNSSRKKFKIKNPKTACVAVKRMWDRNHPASTVMYFKLADGTIREMWDPWGCGDRYFGELMEATGTKFDSKDAFTLLHELYEQLPFN